MGKNFALSLVGQIYLQMLSENEKYFTRSHYTQFFCLAPAPFLSILQYNMLGCSSRTLSAGGKAISSELWEKRKKKKPVLAVASHEINDYEYIKP